MKLLLSLMLLMSFSLTGCAHKSCSQKCSDKKECKGESCKLKDKQEKKSCCA